MNASEAAQLSHQSNEDHLENGKKLNKLFDCIKIEAMKGRYNCEYHPQSEEFNFTEDELNYIKKVFKFTIYVRNSQKEMQDPIYYGVHWL